jgi:hypothetical protein
MGFVGRTYIRCRGGGPLRDLAGDHAAGHTVGQLTSAAQEVHVMSEHNVHILIVATARPGFAGELVAALLKNP